MRVQPGGYVHGGHPCNGSLKRICNFGFPATLDIYPGKSPKSYCPGWCNMISLWCIYLRFIWISTGSHCRHLSILGSKTSDLVKIWKGKFMGISWSLNLNPKIFPLHQVLILVYSLAASNGLGGALVALGVHMLSSCLGWWQPSLVLWQTCTPKEKWWDTSIMVISCDIYLYIYIYISIYLYII